MIDDTIQIIRGDDEAIEITVRDEAGDTVLVVGDVFFLTAKMRVDDDVTDAAAIFKDDYTIGVGDDLDPFVIDLSNTETELPLGSYFADIQWKDTAGKIKTIWRGQLNVTYDVTRRKTV